MTLVHENRSAMCGNETIISIEHDHRNEKEQQQQQENDSISPAIVMEQIDTANCAYPGIKDKLFSKFVTISDSGSGLYISKDIIEDHYGRIWAENNKDGKGGATFAFSLPIT